MIKLAIPDIGEEELEAIKEVLDSKFLVQGDKVEVFENQLKNYLGVKHAIAVSSGTAALHLALLALDIKQGDEVIVPDFTFPATANVVEVVGATTKLVDIQLESFCMDANKIEEKITDKTKAIMPVQEFGQVCDMDKIMEIAKKYDLNIIEDAACALGTEYKGKKAGTIGDIGCFSLHPRKAITTGEGGIVVTNNDELAEKIKILRNHGMYLEAGKTVFKAPGLNYRMTNIQGAMGIVQMKKLEILNTKRAQLAKMYNELLKDIPNIICPCDLEGKKRVWQTYHILLPESADRDEIIEKMKLKGIQCNFGAYAVHEQEYYKEKYRDSNEQYPNSYYAYHYGLALPLHKDITNSELKYIVEELEKGLYGRKYNRISKKTKNF